MAVPAILDLNWYDGIASVTEAVECGPAGHRIKWDGESLSALDHDPDAEKVLGSLGGELPTCLQILEAWEWGTRDLESISFILDDFDIPAESVIAANLANLQQSFANIKTRLPAGHPSLLKSQEAVDQTRRRLLLVSLPQGLRQRLELEMMVELEKKLGAKPDDIEPSETDHRELQSSYAHRATAESLLARRANPEIEKCMGAWGRIPTGSITVETRVIDEAEKPTLVGWFDSSGGLARASLPLSWLRRIWARDLAVIDGCFILDLEEGEGGHRRVTAARWEQQASEIEGRSTPVVEDALLMDSGPGAYLLGWSSSGVGS